jgi:hypothetical protein
MKNAFQKLLARKEWPVRIQSSFLAEQKLQAELRQCENWLSKAQERIGELKTNSARLAALSLNGQYAHPSHLEGVLADLRDLESKLPAYEELRTSLRVKLDAVVHPQPAQVAEQVKQRTALAKLGSSRLSADRKLDRMIRDLERALKARQVLSAKMEAVASVIGLKIKDLAEKRFDSLQAALPSDVIAESEGWAREFCGERDGEEYAVVSESFTLPETLGHNGIFRPGDRVRISDEEAARLPKGYFCPVEGTKAKGRRLLAPAMVQKAEPAPAPAPAAQGQRSPQELYDERKQAKAGGFEF